MSSAYYNEIDPFCAQWLRNLIAAGHIMRGDVDERSIKEVRANDLRGYRQAHFFAGIGVWSYALRLAGWPDDREVWTGSCPCQPFSSAGTRKGFDDARHLWPVWQRLIAERLPATIFGEQVAQAPDWLVIVRSDLEALAYAVGAMPIEAACAGAEQPRDRFWFVAHTNRKRKSLSAVNAKVGCTSAVTIFALDDSWRSAEPPMVGVVHGTSAGVGHVRAYGNTIVPQVAAAFIGAFMECAP